jgi:L-threonylcarbamoyladenylate synthase
MNRAERIYFRDIAGGDDSSIIFNSMISDINNESLIIYPTETIYGIGGIASPNVEKKIFSIKKRKTGNPILLIAGSIDKFSYLNLRFNTESKKLANVFWPGHLTLILPGDISNSTVGVRVSDHPFLRLISDYVNLPLYSTSANLSGEDYCSDPDDIYDIFKDTVDLMIDYGKLPESPPSTVVDATENKNIRVVREGSITKDMIFDTLNQR